MVEVLRGVVLLLLLPLLLPTAAAAQADDPEITDPCGVTVMEDGFVLQGDPDHPAVDICSASFATLGADDEPTVMAVTIQLHGDSMEDMRWAALSWTTAGCEFDIVAEDTDRIEIPEGHVGAADQVEVVVRCGRTAVPCSGTFVGSCTDYEFELEHEAQMALDRVRFAGNSVEFAVDFTDPALAGFADLHAHGVELTDLGVAAATTVLGSGIGEFSCIGGTCVGATYDSADGDRYIVGS
jgi:hypothetical protein